MTRKAFYLAVVALVLSASPATAQLKPVVERPGEKLLADFEGHPNRLKGNVGIVGAAEWDPDLDPKDLPYSWYYSAKTPGYTPRNVHEGAQSFRLVNALGRKKNEDFAVFYLDLGPVTDRTTRPVKGTFRNVKPYKYLTFWAKGEKGGEVIEVLFRDHRAVRYNPPQVRVYMPKLSDHWEKYVVHLSEVGKKVDLKHLDNVSVSFGRDAGNRHGAVLYVDDFWFTNYAYPQEVPPSE